MPFFGKFKKDEKSEDIVRRYLGISKKIILFIMLFSSVINLLALLPSIYMLAVYDIVVPSTSVPTLLFITALVIFLYAIFGSLQIIRSKILHIIGKKLEKNLNRDIILSSFSYAIRHPSQASAQPLNDMVQIKQFLTSPALFAFFDLPWSPIFLIVLFLFHVYYGIAAVIFFSIITIIAILNEYFTRKALREANNFLIRSNNFLTKTLQNAEVIEAMGMHDNIYNKWRELYRKYEINSDKATNINTTLSNILRVSRILSQSLMLGLGGYLAIKHEITSGMIVAGSILLGRFLAPIDTIVSSWRIAFNAYISYKRLNEFLRNRPVYERTINLPPPKGEITLRQVVVIPPEGKEPVLKNVSLRILPGETVAVIGPSASGKSSLLRTILGIWKPVNGKVEIDGADINQWDKRKLGRYIGYLPQDIELFEGTVAENIARFSKIDEKKVLEAAVISGAHDVIIKLPKGYDTYIGPGGITLSAGQRQRIALARAIYGDPKIVILDEPDANLDDEGELALHRAIAELKKRGVTLIIVSHKLKILNLADKIAVMRNGTIAMYGQAELVLQKLMEKRIK